MKVSYCTFCCAILLFLYSCYEKKPFNASTIYKSGTYSSDSVYLQTDLKKVLSKPSKYHNIKIELEGYYEVTFETSALYTTRQALDNRNRNKAIWIELSFFDSLQEVKTQKNLLIDSNELENIQRKRVIIQGVFNAEYKGHEEQFQGALKEIHMIKVGTNK